MNTISIDSNIYHGAEMYAKLHNVSVIDFIESAIATAVGNIARTRVSEPYSLKAEKELSREVQSLIGIAKAPDVYDDINGKTARIEHTMEECGI